MPPTYTDLLDSLSPLILLAEDSQLPLPSELELQALWFTGQFGKNFTSACGKPITIRQFGFWNRSAGPDFAHASVELDGETLTGSIELDTSIADWEHHGHAQNPAFNDTILHISFLRDSKRHFIRTAEHRDVAQLHLTSTQIRNITLPPLRSLPTAHIGRCYQPLAQASELQIFDLFEQAARHRCHHKARHLAAIDAAHGSTQRLWLSLAETLGYHNNKLAMQLLAQRVPINSLLQRPGDITAISILFGTAGFLHPDIHKSSPTDSQQWLESLWQQWWKIRDDFQLNSPHDIPWTLSGNRPVNHPQRRLAALSLIATQWQQFNHIATSQLSELTTFLTSLSHPFWSHHYTLRSKATDKAMSLIGKDRCHEFLINHLLPPLIDRGDHSAWQLYSKLPAPQKNTKVLRTHTRLFGDNPAAKQFLKKAWHHQALIQLYHDFCLLDTSDCAQCPFPEQLSQFIRK